MSSSSLGHINFKDCAGTIYVALDIEVMTSHERNETGLLVNLGVLKSIECREAAACLRLNGYL